MKPLNKLYKIFGLHRMVFLQAPGETPANQNETPEAQNPTPPEKEVAAENVEGAKEQADQAVKVANAEALKSPKTLSVQAQYCLERLEGKSDLILAELLEGSKGSSALFSGIEGVTLNDQKEAVIAYLTQRIEGEVLEITKGQKIIDGQVIFEYVDITIKVKNTDPSIDADKIKKTYRLKPFRSRPGNFELGIVQTPASGKVIERKNGEITTEENIGSRRLCNGTIEDFLEKLSTKDNFTESMAN